MKKLAIALAALGVIVLAAPSGASAETIVIKKRGGYHGHHHPGARAQYRPHRHWHRGHRNKVVVIKKYRY